MSWWISLNENGQPLEVSRHAEGGTFLLGGTTEADLNVTYNYGKHFIFKKLDGRTGLDTTKELEEAVQSLGIARDKDYWSPTAGNVGFACSILLDWAKQYPNGVWRVS
jgi:hypothetical protein